MNRNLQKDGFRRYEISQARCLRASNTRHGLNIYFNTAATKDHGGRPVGPEGKVRIQELLTRCG